MTALELREARRLVRYIRDLPVGTTVLLNGYPVEVQWFPGELFGDPDLKKVLKLGNREISVADVARGIAKLELPG